MSSKLRLITLPESKKQIHVPAIPGTIWGPETRTELNELSDEDIQAVGEAWARRFKEKAERMRCEKKSSE